MLAKMVAATTRRITIRPKCKLVYDFPLTIWNKPTFHMEFIGQKVLFIWRQVIFNNRIMKKSVNNKNNFNVFQVFFEKVENIKKNCNVKEVGWPDIRYVPVQYNWIGAKNVNKNLFMN